MKRISALKKIIARLIITIVMLAFLTCIGFALYSIGGWQGLCAVLGGSCILGALAWSLNVLENNEE